MFYLKCLFLLLAWLGQVKLGITVINRYIVFLRDTILKHLLTLGFGLLMISWIPFGILSGAADELAPLPPENWKEAILLFFLLFGIFLYLKASFTSLKVYIHNPFPGAVTGHHSETLHPEKSDNWRSPRFPLFPETYFNAFNDYYSLEINTYKIRCKSLPESFRGFRIGHISDLHCDGRLDERFYEYCISRLNDLKPDIVFVTGDHISRRKYTPYVSDILAEIRSLHGAYILRGNHDFWEKDDRMKKEFREKGLTILDNISLLISQAEDRIRIAGVEHPWNRMKNWDKRLFADDDIFTLCVTHTPDNFIRAAAAGAFLTLCGHTHGGQIRIPFYGPVICPSRFSRKFDQGFFEQDGRLLYVNRGIGSTVPLRVRCPSEIALFILR